MSIKLYFDLMSQPSRALYIILKKSNINFTPQLVNLRGGEHFGEEYEKINRFKKVPVIEHNGFLLTESVAIIKYLARENLIPETLYPTEVKAQARVDEFLEWQHTGLRLHCAMYFRIAYMNPILFGKKVSEESVRGWLTRMETALNDFDTLWLGRGHDFVTGNTPTVADIFAACEIEQTRMAGYDPMKYPNINVWSKKVKDHFNPYYDEAHVILNKICKKHTESKL